MIFFSVKIVQGRLQQILTQRKIIIQSRIGEDNWQKKQV